MPSITMVHALLASRLGRSFEAWRERIDLELRARGRDAVALVRVSPAEDPAMIVSDWFAVEFALRIKIVRHLGGPDFLVALQADGDQNQLALNGHLDVTRDGYRMVAV